MDIFTPLHFVSFIALSSFLVNIFLFFASGGLLVMTLRPPVSPFFFQYTGRLRLPVLCLMNRWIYRCCSPVVICIQPNFILQMWIYRSEMNTVRSLRILHLFHKSLFIAGCSLNDLLLRLVYWITDSISLLSLFCSRLANLIENLFHRNIIQIGYVSKFYLPFLCLRHGSVASCYRGYIISQRIVFFGLRRCHMHLSEHWLWLRMMMPSDFWHSFIAGKAFLIFPCLNRSLKVLESVRCVNQFIDLFLQKQYGQFAFISFCKFMVALIHQSVNLSVNRFKHLFKVLPHFLFVIFLLHLFMEPFYIKKITFRWVPF